MTDEIPVRVIGMGPFPLPGKKRSRRKPERDARRLLRMVDEVGQPAEGQEPSAAEHDG